MFYGRGLIYVSNLTVLMTVLKWFSLKLVTLVVTEFLKELNYHKM
jgi:hypothetical protein